MTSRAATLDQIRDLLDWLDDLGLTPTQRECMVSLIERADHRLRATITVTDMAQSWRVKTSTTYRRLADLGRAGHFAWAPYAVDAATGVSSNDRRRWILFMHPATPWRQYREQRALERQVFFAMAPEIFRQRRERMAARMDGLQCGELDLAAPQHPPTPSQSTVPNPADIWAEWTQP